VVFFPGPHPMLICNPLLTIISRRPLGIYEKPTPVDADISFFNGAPLGKIGSQWE
jgi:hypothetical protein